MAAACCSSRSGVRASLFAYLEHPLRRRAGTSPADAAGASLGAVQRQAPDIRGGLPPRWAAAGVGVGAVAAIVVLALAPPAPKVGAGSARSFRLPSPLPAAPAGPTRGTLAWSFQTGGRITGRPAVDGQGRAYVASHDGRLYALSRGGTLRFERELGAAAFGGPLLVGDRIHVGTDAGELHTFDLEGRALGRVMLPPAIERPPVVGPYGLLLVAAGRELLALASDGTVAWRFEVYAKIFGAPASDGERIAFGAQDHHLYVLGPDGRKRQVFNLGADVDMAPVIAPDGTIFVGADDGRLHAVPPSGPVRWSVRFDGRLRAAVALVGEDSLLLATHGLRPGLHVVARDDGAVRASLSLGLTDSAEHSLRAAPVVGAGPVAYLGAPGQRILALGADGREVFSHATRGHVNATPTLAPDGTLYVGADDGVLYAFRDR